MWTVTLRDHTGSYHSAATTQVDKADYPTVDEAIAQAMVQLGIRELNPYLAHTWWEIQ